jgi:hypothetical protein
MKRFIAVLALVLTGFVFASTANAQDYRNDRYQDRDRYQEYNRRYDEDRRNRRQDYYRRTYVVFEQRYVRFGREVYREVYKSMYRGDRLIRRQLIRRERVSFNRRNGYRDRQGLEFNVFLRF